MKPHVGMPLTEFGNGIGGVMSVLPVGRLFLDRNLIEYVSAHLIQWEIFLLWALRKNLVSAKVKTSSETFTCNWEGFFGDDTNHAQYGRFNAPSEIPIANGEHEQQDEKRFHSKNFHWRELSQWVVQVLMSVRNSRLHAFGNKWMLVLWPTLSHRYQNAHILLRRISVSETSHAGILLAPNYVRIEVTCIRLLKHVDEISCFVQSTKYSKNRCKFPGR